MNYPAHPVYAYLPCTASSPPFSLNAKLGESNDDRQGERQRERGEREKRCQTDKAAAGTDSKPGRASRKATVEQQPVKQ